MTSASRRDRLAATVYTTDDVAHAVWKDEIGLPPERLVRWGDFPAGDEKNWWRMGDVGPCGPCSELHYDRGAHLAEGPECVPDHSEHCPRWLEVWNLVFMEFELHPDRSLTPLPAPGVDTGMGLERVASVVQGVTSNYDTDLFAPIHATDARAPGLRPGRVRGAALQLPGHRGPQPRRSRSSSRTASCRRTRAAATCCAGSCAARSATGGCSAATSRSSARRRRSSSRRCRRRTRTSRSAGPRSSGSSSARSASSTAPSRPASGCSRSALIPLTDAERVVGRSADSLPTDAPVLPGAVAFRLHDTYGFPIDLTVELAAEYGVRTDLAGFQDALAEQRDRSRSGTKAELAKTNELISLYNGLLARTGADRVPRLRDHDRRRARRRHPARRRRVRDRSRRSPRSSCAPRPAPAPRSSSTARRSTPRAAGRSPTPAGSSRRTAPSCSTSTTSSASPARRPRASPSTAACSTVPSASATSCAPRWTRSVARTRCATTPGRTCSTARCATSLGSGHARRARSSRRTTCASTSRSSAA